MEDYMDYGIERLEMELDERQEAQFVEYISVIEELTGSDLSLLSPWLSILTLERMIHDIGAGMSHDMIVSTMKEINGSYIKMERINEVERIIRGIEGMVGKN